MTISKLTFESIEETFISWVFPSQDVSTVPEHILKKEGIQLVANDLLITIRNSPTEFWDQASHQQRRMTCLGFCKKIFKPIFAILCNTDVDTYVICLDPFNRRRPEKAATTSTRYDKVKSGRPTYLELPRGQDRYFEFKKPFPGPMELVFATLRARAELYVMFKDFITSAHIYSLIPEGKQIILSGSLSMSLNSEDYEEGSASRDKLGQYFKAENDVMVYYRNEPPIKITKAEGPWVVTAWDFPSLAEGDLDAWRWVDIFHKKNFHVISGDGDLLPIGFLQMPKIISLNPERRGFYITRRSVGSAVNPNREPLLASKRAKYQLAIDNGSTPEDAYLFSGGASSSVAPEKQRKSPIWLDRYIDIVNIYKFILSEARSLNTHHGAKITAPAELYVAAICLSSKKHDYIQCNKFAPQVGSLAIWMAFRYHIAELSTMIKVFKRKDSRSLHFRYYCVDVSVLRNFLLYCYEEYANMSVKPSKKNNTPAKIEQEKLRRFTEHKNKHMPTQEQTQIIASQLAWVLQYWGNGIHVSNSIVDATLAIDPESGKPIYGYTPVGWADSVSPSTFKIAPPRGTV